jgi:hypothetical protein
MIVDSKGTNDPYIQIIYENKTSSSREKKDLINSVKKLIHILIILLLRFLMRH